MADLSAQLSGIDPLTVYLSFLPVRGVTDSEMNRPHAALYEMPSNCGLGLAASSVQVGPRDGAKYARGCGQPPPRGVFLRPRT